ncbi:MAG TPA: hypothetical protein PK536_06955 [Ignavibacteria bacterium]|nr:hypothetical protein [Ignavibacteria bacterium]HRJ99815.1 hypothetical protein [Ignavibacteria bacterium]
MKNSEYDIQRQGSVSILQFKTDYADTFSYISLNAALRDKYVEISETNVNGEVNKIRLINKSEFYVFISDGDILTGAKQNRVINTSALIAPDSETDIPVSCVEAGRWKFKTREFTGTDFYFPTNMRRNKSKDILYNLRTDGRHSANQSRVWNEVNEYEEILKMKSSTSDLSELLSRKRGEIDETMNHFRVKKGSNGMAVFFGKKIFCIEIFNSTEIFEECFPKLLGSVGVDFLTIQNSDVLPSEEEIKELTTMYLNKLSETSSETFKGIGVGKERRFNTRLMTGAELFYVDLKIHVSVQFENIRDSYINRDARGRKILNFGKYKGQALNEVFRSDINYIIWLCFESNIDRNLKKEIYDEFLKFSGR